MRRIAAVTCLALVGLLAGCASRVPGQDVSSSASSDPSASPVGTAAPALDLLPTVWHVHGAAGADPATYLLFTTYGVEVLEPKGFVLGTWSTEGDQLLTMITGGSESLAAHRTPSVPWLTATTTFRRTNTGWTLLDANGRTVATLSDDGPAPTQPDTETTPSPVDSYARAQVADAVAGSGARMPTVTELVGLWGADGLDPAHASLRLRADGSWTITGGCESGTGEDLTGAGDYRVIAGGFLLRTEFPVAGVGCAPAPAHLPADAAALLRFSDARSVLLQGDHLTLFDKSGARIGTLTRLG